MTAGGWWLKPRLEAAPRSLPAQAGTNEESAPTGRLAAEGRAWRLCHEACLRRLGRKHACLIGVLARRAFAFFEEPTAQDDGRASDLLRVGDGVAVRGVDALADKPEAEVKGFLGDGPQVA